MQLNVNLLMITMPSEISYGTGKPQLRQEGFKPLPTVKVKDLTEEQATKYADEMRDAFINHWKSETTK